MYYYNTINRKIKIKIVIGGIAIQISSMKAFALLWRATAIACVVLHFCQIVMPQQARRRLCADDDEKLQEEVQKVAAVNPMILFLGIKNCVTAKQYCTNEQAAVFVQAACPVTCGICVPQTEGLPPLTCNNSVVQGGEKSPAENAALQLPKCWHDGVEDPSNSSSCECEDDPSFRDPFSQQSCSVVYRMYLILYAPQCTRDTGGYVSPSSMKRVRKHCPKACGICRVVAPRQREGQQRGNRNAACNFASDVVNADSSTQVWDLDGGSVCTRCNQTTIMPGASLHVRGVAKAINGDAVATVSGGDATRHFLVHEPPPPRPPREPPAHLRHLFDMGGRIRWAGWYWDNRVPETPSVKNDAALGSLLAQALSRTPQEAVYPNADKWLFQALDAYPIGGKTVLIVGSQVPWYESLSLVRGAKRVVVVEWQPIQYTGSYPLQYIRPDDLWDRSASGMLTPKKEWQGVFDAVVSISSEEHNGLGRYGDPINADADIQHMDALRRLLLPTSGYLFLAVPTGTDCIVWNAHRVYGPIRWPALTRQWIEVDSFGYSESKRDSIPPCPQPSHQEYQPIFILQASQSRDERQVEHSQGL